MSKIEKWKTRAESWHKAEFWMKFRNFPDKISMRAILFLANAGYLLDADATQAREKTFTCERRGEPTGSKAGEYEERSR